MASVGDLAVTVHPQDVPDRIDRGALTVALQALGLPERDAVGLHIDGRVAQVTYRRRARNGQLAVAGQHVATVTYTVDIEP